MHRIAREVDNLIVIFVRSVSQMSVACGRSTTYARQHFQNRFTKEPGLYELEFHSYSADFPRLSSTEATSSEGKIKDFKAHKALKIVCSSKSPELNGLSYELYLRLSPVCTNLDSSV